MSVQTLKKCASIGAVRPLIHGCSYGNIRQAITKRLTTEYQCLLAELNAGTNLQWYIDSSQGEFRPVIQASPNERTAIDEALSRAHQEIRRAIQGTEAAPYVDQVLTYPSEEALFYRYDAEGRLQLCITQWGYALHNKPTPPLPPPPKPSSESKPSKRLLVRYSTGVVLQNKQLYLCKQGYTPFAIHTDAGGEYNLDQTLLPDGAVLEISEDAKMQSKQSFVLISGQELYEVVFPVYTEAKVELRNQQQEPLAGQVLQINGKSYQTDASGQVLLQNLDLGVLQQIEVQVDNTPREVYYLDIDPLANHFVYYMEQALTTEAGLRVINQEGNPRPEYELLVNGQKHCTDALGQIHLDSIPWTDTTMLHVSDPQGSFRAEYPLALEAGQNVFEILTHEDFACSLLLSVVYPDHKPANDYTIQLEQGDEAHIVTTDAQGLYRIDPAEPGLEYGFRDAENAQNFISIKPRRGEESVVLIVERPRVPLYHFYLLDAKGLPIKAQALEMQIESESPLAKTTKLDGHFAHPRSAFSIGDRVQVKFRASGINGRKEERSFKLQSKIKEGQDKYTLQVRGWNKRWLWSLLLIPFIALLFVNYNRDIQIQTVLANGKPCSGVAVQAQFVSHYLYKDGAWFTTDTLNKAANVGEDGTLKFKDVGMSGFSHVFYMLEELSLRPSSECLLAMDTLMTHKLHWTLPGKLFKLRMYEHKTNVSVRVLNQEFGNPIKGATLHAYFQRDGETIEYTTQTDGYGDAQIPQIALCGQIDSIRVERYGYVAHRSTNLLIKGLIEGVPNLTINLTPNKERITFFVKNSATHEPLPSAMVVLTFKNRQSGDVFVDSVMTNVDGMGVGYFDDLRVQDELELKASCIFFKSASFGQSTTVQQFIARDEEARTVYLEPEQHIIGLKCVNKETGDAIPGILVKYSLANKPDNIYQQMSNNNGKINVRATPNDELLVSVDETSEYEALKSQSIQIDKDSIIKLQPRLLSIPIEVIDAIDKSYVSGSTISCIPASILVQPAGDGKFILQAKGHEVLTIYAEHPNYQPNQQSISGVRAIDLLRGDHIKRQIELSLPECTVSQVSNSQHGNNGFVQEYNMGVPSGRFELMYDTDRDPDKIEVFDGRAKEIASKKPLWSYEGATANEIGVNKYKSQMIDFHSPIISIKVTGQTIVRIIVNCPK